MQEWKELHFHQLQGKQEEKSKKRRQSTQNGENTDTAPNRRARLPYEQRSLQIRFYFQKTPSKFLLNACPAPRDPGQHTSPPVQSAHSLCPTRALNYVMKKNASSLGQGVKRSALSLCYLPLTQQREGNTNQYVFLDSLFFLLQTTLLPENHQAVSFKQSVNILKQILDVFYM